FRSQGCFALVLEHIPAALAGRLRRELDIPVIGIGAGPDCDGQILVTADLLGLTGRQPPFVKPRLQGAEMFKQALQGWCHEQRHQEQTDRPPKEGNPPTPGC
ncbi:MAG: 3-methyl-2-oxobutanoate hydroxymethyltransferase, partial [Cyanobacteria bacterium MAG IRC3_bin_20]|nr:3-methyl-2-oxobutanoate hydroxymethyltransferase [Cyanobacteria bacterium MAG IRC3_bin_20]